MNGSTMQRKCYKCNGDGSFQGVECDVCCGQGSTKLADVVRASVAPKNTSKDTTEKAPDETKQEKNINECNQILTMALDQLECIVIVGYDKHGREYYASNIDDAANAIWHLQRGVHLLNKIVDDFDDEK